MSMVTQLRRHEQTKANQAPEQTDCATAFPCVRYDYDAGEPGEEYPSPPPSRHQGDKQDRKHCRSDGLPVVLLFPEACVYSSINEWRTSYSDICGEDQYRGAGQLTRAHPLTFTQCRRTRQRHTFPQFGANGGLTISMAHLVILTTSLTTSTSSLIFPCSPWKHFDA